MELGNPSGATADPSNHSHYLIQRTVESLDYNDSLGEPNWVSWDLTSPDIGPSGRSSDFFPDKSLPAGFTEITTDDYDGVGAIFFNRGHMCPSEDRTDNTNDNDMVFLMSNIIPQAATNNQGVWGNFEAYCQTQAKAGNELLITCGPSLFNGTSIPSGKVQIPRYTWKIAVIVPPGAGTAASRITASTRVISLKIPNSNNVTANWSNYVTSASQIEVDTGFTFFTALPTDIAAVLRAEVDGQTGPPPMISSFSPTSGGVGTNVIITGTNFNSTSAVAFNGVPATFTVNSPTQITATVPGSVSSGAISVTTPNGTAISSGAFTVTGLSTDLSITATHAANFTQGDIGQTYTITVKNSGTLASSGTVSVTDTLPTDLTATAINGTGWTTSLSPLTCTRTDALAVGASFPPLTVTVNVSTNASALVTNIASVSGGGDSNLANNTANDPTTINASSGGGVINTNVVVLAGWDTSGITSANGFGPSPFAPATNVPNVTIIGLTRASGVVSNSGGAARGWGGANFSSATPAAAIAANQFCTFGLTANNGFTVSYNSISAFNYRHSATGPTNGLLQYQIGSGSFVDIASFGYPVNSSSVGTLNPIDLSLIPALQNVPAGSNVTFRIVNSGGAGGGTWYIFDVAASPAPDLAISGTISPVVVGTPNLSVSSTHNGTFTQGDLTGDTYTITVTNSGNAATTGAISLADTLPAGLTATDISGPNWTLDLDALTATRSDSLAPGASFPPVTIFVSIATNAATIVTNVVTLTNNSQIISLNDPTTIIALTPIQAWRLLFFGTTVGTGLAADTAITTTDGMANLLKYAFGLNPLLSATNPIIGDLANGHLRMTLPKNPDATDVSFHVEQTGDLANPSWSTNGTVTDQNTPTLLQVHDTNSVDAPGTQGYLRLRVSRP